ncbi:MAG: exodeoxyribonuclease VII large subunit [Phycisphaerales bacterium]|nr:exodeoxyribonuclease VII large subunit [Phycisphaerales bacterium]
MLSSRPMTVYQVAQLIKAVLAEYAPLPVKVVGEVSNFTNRTHWFFFPQR